MGSMINGSVQVYKVMGSMTSKVAPTSEGSFRILYVLRPMTFYRVFKRAL